MFVRVNVTATGKETKIHDMHPVLFRFLLTFGQHLNIKHRFLISCISPCYYGGEPKISG